VLKSPTGNGAGSSTFADEEMNSNRVVPLAVALALLAAPPAPIALAQSAIEECRQDNAEHPALIGCLDKRLKQANLQLNATLKSAQERIEQLEKDNRRAAMASFIDSQRKFNAYRDSNCTWHAVQAEPGNRGEEFVKDCQIRATLQREQDLAAFAERHAAAAATPAAESKEPVHEQAQDEPPPPPAVVQENVLPPPEPLGKPEDAATSVAWRLVSWIDRGKERPLLPDSTISVAFAPSGKLSGNASVNRFNGQYRFNADGELEWPKAGFALTRMAGPPALMKQEQAFLNALRRTRQLRAEGDQLVLQSNDSSVVLTFVR
jgi:heat shock protein HslJ/uncharacterized protein YecT (DUF1311 family)